VENANNKGGSSILFYKYSVPGPVLQYCVMMIEHDDFSVVVKNWALPPKSWRWEIHRAGRRSPIEHSKVLFASMTEANRAGKAALRSLLSDYPD
jgi:hypothetical protein